jgi:hypothetical protein
LITAQDVVQGLATAQPIHALPAPAQAAPLRERILLAVLYVTVLASSVAIIEPSPHDVLVVLLALTCIAAGVHFDRKTTALFLMLVIWNSSGLLSLINVVDREKTIQYSATSLYLSAAAVVWAMLLSQNTMARLTVLRSAYVLTAFLSSVAGVCGYLNAFPGAYELFAAGGRAMGAFKDPNVYSPFLIWPALVVLERMLVRRISLMDAAILVTLLAALLVAFSRGAWVHFGISSFVLIVFTFVTAKQTKTRLRLVYMSVIAIVALAGLVVALLSVPEIYEMFNERAHLLNSYDVGDGGRFRLQETAVAAVLDHVNGMGPFGFASTQANQQHNVYLQAFLVYGWLGGTVYILMLLTTLKVALRSVFVTTPWQPYLIVTIAAFVGEVLEGFIIDTDHWRHFFLLLGMIWGLFAATSNYIREQSMLLPTTPTGLARQFG